MDMSFLEEYQHSELVAQEHFLKDIKDAYEGKVKPDQTDDSEPRRKLNRPYAYSIVGRPIWPLIPVYGTTIVRLQAVREPSTFSEYHGFEVEDIPRLVEFSKRTGRIMFALQDWPTAFEGMQFLEPIFYELRPRKWVGLESFLGIKGDDLVELMSIGGGFFDFVAEGRHEPDAVGRVRVTACETYAQLRSLGFDEIADYIKYSLTENQYRVALALIAASRDYLLDPYLDPLRPIRTQARDIGEFEREILNPFGLKAASNVEFPFEVGKFLAEKLRLIVPKNMEGAIEVAERYDQADIKGAVEALDEAIKQEKPNAAIAKAKQISEMCEDIWRRTEKVRKKQEYVQKYGVSLSFAAIGSIVTLQLGGLGGLLTGLGFSVVDKLLGEKASRGISRRITKWTTASHMVHLYDFRRRYGDFDVR
jgi:hypothetical protein